MMGRAGRPQYDSKGVAVIMVHEPKKAFYKRFLYEPFPVESSLADQVGGVDGVCVFPLMLAVAVNSFSETLQSFVGSCSRPGTKYTSQWEPRCPCFTEWQQSL
jgi:hypothetical protein